MFEQIIKMNGMKTEDLRKQNIALIGEISVLKEEKAIQLEMIKILFGVIKKFGYKCNEISKEREELALSFNQLVIAQMPKEEGVEYVDEITPNIKPIYKEVILNETMLRGINDIEMMKKLIEEHDKFVFA